MDSLPVPSSGKLLLLAAPRSYLRQALPTLIARLALANDLRVLDMGNSFNLHQIARALRRHTARVQERLEHIQLARAFTFYQVLSLLASAPADGVPTFCLDLLATFYDETDSLAERRRLLRKCLRHLRRLSRSGPVAVAVFTPTADQPDEWQALVEENVDVTWRLRHPDSPKPMRLF